MLRFKFERIEEIHFNWQTVDANFQVAYADHASAYTLSHLLNVIQPERVHPLVEYELCNNSMSQIPMEILSENCEVVNNFVLDEQCVSSDVTLNDVTAAMKGSFLDPTIISGISLNSDEEANIRSDAITILR